MSGDHEPREYLAGAVRALRADPELRTQLVGDPQLISAALAGLPEPVRSSDTAVGDSQEVQMQDKPPKAIRHKKQSSMRVAVDLVQAGTACACVSAGNTGALTAIAHFVLGTLPGVERAAIISAIPAAHGHTHMLDLGANTKATPEQLRQFAAMGAIIARDVYGLAAPRIGLLNIGEEDMKGHEVVQAAHALLTRSRLNYVGFVEGDDIFAGTVDVVVTDGFTGNVALKTMEGVAGLIADRDRKSTRLNSSHVSISYAVFCLKKKKNMIPAASSGKSPKSTHSGITMCSVSLPPPSYHNSPLPRPPSPRPATTSGPPTSLR